MSDTAGTSLGLLATEDVALVDVLDRVLCSGVVIAGDVIISLADIDLVRVSLRALVSSVEALEKA